ncbi:MAG: zinc ribbon domain-containing protein [Eubacteriales bacterium]|nr:zinc ribbon domain-containing protein [Eubacteriales bacterium]
MFCPKCGKEIPDDALFCGSCGARLAQSGPQPSAARSGRQESPKPAKQVKKKRKNSIFITILVVAAATAVGQGVGKMMAGSYVKDRPSASVLLSTEGSGTAGSDAGSAADTQTAAGQSEDNPEYMKIFSDRYIVKGPLVTLGDTASYAKVDEDGSVHCLDFAYHDDVITMFQETIYTELATAEVDGQTLDDGMREYFSKYDSLGILTYDSNIGATYHRFTYKVDNLDDPEILKKAEDSGLLTTTGENGGLMSMDLTHASMMEQGYVKR